MSGYDVVYSDPVWVAYAKPRDIPRWQADSCGSVAQNPHLRMCVALTWRVGLYTNTHTYTHTREAVVNLPVISLILVGLGAILYLAGMVSERKSARAEERARASHTYIHYVHERE